MFFTWVFILEALIKLACLGVAGYFYDGYNCFDFILVLFSCLDVMAEIALGAAGKSGNELFNGGFFNMLRVVRMCRLLRVLRLISISKIHRKKSMAASQLDFTRLMGIMASASIWVANVLGLLFLVVYMGAIVSMQFFGGRGLRLERFLGTVVQKRSTELRHLRHVLHHEFYRCYGRWVERGHVFHNARVWWDFSGVLRTYLGHSEVCHPLDAHRDHF